ncbi:MAG: hypothetical protein WBX22_01650 [Silvibacterium sp.]
MTDGRDYRLHAFRRIRFRAIKDANRPKAIDILDAQVSEGPVRKTDAIRAEIDFTALFRDPDLITSGRGLICRIEDAAN